MNNTNIQSSQNLIAIKGNSVDLKAFKTKVFYDNEHFFWEPNLIQDLTFEIDDLERSFSVISYESQKELHYYIKCIRRQSLDLSSIAIEFPELKFSHVIINSNDDSVNFFEYSKCHPGIEFELKIPADYLKWQNSFSAFSIANIEELHLKIQLNSKEKTFVFDENIQEFFDFYSLISRAEYVKRFKQTLISFIQNEQDLKSTLPDFICERSSPIKINSIYNIVKFYTKTLDESELALKTIIDLFTRTLENQTILTYNECKAVNYTYQFLNIKYEILDFSKKYIDIQCQKADDYIKNYDDYCKLLSEHEGLVPEYKGFDDYFIKDYVAKYQWLTSDVTNKYFEKISEIPVIDIYGEAILFQEEFFEILKHSRKKAKTFVDKRWDLMRKIEKKLIECESNFQNNDFRIMPSILLNDYFFDNQLLKIVSHHYKFPLLNDDDSEDQPF